MLTLIKLLHTAVWAFMVACIAGIYAFSAAGRPGWALAAIGIVTAEVVVLFLNRMRCPLTPLAARYTEERRPNFDIYLPEWVARYNKEIFGTLYAGGILFTMFTWVRR
jgi:hypothetical protein